MTIDENGCIQFKDTEELKSLIKVIELWKKSALITGFNEESGEWEVVAGPNRTQIDIAKEEEELKEKLIDGHSISFKAFDYLRKCHGTEAKQIEVVQFSLLRFHGCPSCYITIPPGPPIFVC